MGYGRKNQVNTDGSYLFYRYLNFIASIYADRINVTPFAIIIGQLYIKAPYINQRKTPQEKMIYITSDRSLVCLVRYTLITCGKNDAVVQSPAILAIKSNWLISHPLILLLSSNMILPAAYYIKHNPPKMIFIVI